MWFKGLISTLCVISLFSCAIPKQRVGKKLDSSEELYTLISQNIYTSGDELIFDATLLPSNTANAIFKLETIEGERLCDSKKLELLLEEGKLTPVILSVKKGDCPSFRFLIEPVEKYDASSQNQANKEQAKLGLTSVIFQPLAVNCKGLDCSSEIKLIADLIGDPLKTYNQVKFKLTGWAKGRDAPIIKKFFKRQISLDDQGAARVEEAITVPVDVSIFDFEGELELIEALD